MQDVVTDVAARTLGKALLQALKDEIAAVPDVWQKMTSAAQAPVLDRLAARIEHEVGRAIRILAAGDRPTITATLESVTIKEGAKLALKVGTISEELHVLLDQVGSAVLVTLIDPETYTKSASEVQPDADEPELPLGGEGDEGGDEPFGPDEEQRT